MKRVAIVQTEKYFTPELQKKYLEGIPLLTSNNFKHVYAFIIKNAKKNAFLNLF